MIDIAEPLDTYKEFPGPILLLAGPGTGKTYQLAMRIKFLIENQSVDPNEICVMTFTNEAARNMRDRLSHDDINIPKEKHPSIISTMHSLGNSIIGQNPEKFGLSEIYDVLTDKHSRNVLLKDASILAGYGIEDSQETDECRRKGSCNKNTSEKKCRICIEYEKILRKCSLVDYDDQILLACQALKEDEKLLRTFKNKTKHLLIDEYQDINQAQFNLIKLLSKDQEEGLFIVGDDDQSIYSFRGGTPIYIQDIDQFFSIEFKIGRLSKSWRCPKHILEGARAMLTKFYGSSVPKPEPSFSEKISINEKIKFFDVPSAEVESQIIRAIIKEKIKSNSIKIIIPNINYLEPIREALFSSEFDYKYKLSLNDDGLERFIIIGNWCTNPKNSLYTRYLLHLIAYNFDELTKLVKSATEKITEKRVEASKLLAMIWKDVDNTNSFFDILNSKQSDSNEFMKEISNTLNNLLELMTKSGKKRKSLPDFLFNSGQLVSPGKNPHNLISEIIEWKNEIIGGNKTSSFEPVYIYNLPSSKGLEGDVVIVIGVSDELFPKLEADIEEQSRLFYVAMTRAKKELYLFSSRTRSGSITFKKDSYQLKPSCFVDCIPNEHIEKKYIKPKLSK